MRYLSITSSFIAITLIAMAQSAAEPRCQALALQGGGDRGAYQVGALMSFLDYREADASTYDVVTGISVGALNGLALSIFEAGDERNAVAFMEDLWMRISKEDIFVPHEPFGLLTGILARSGLFDNSPLRNLVEEEVNEKVHRKMIYGTCDAVTAEYHAFDETETDEDIIDGVVASAAIPVVFPHKDYKESHYFDGGAIQGVDIVSAINACKAMGFEERNIDLDMINLASNSIEHAVNEKKKALGMLTRYLEISNYFRGAENLERGMHIFEEVNFRHVVIPHEKFASGPIPISFKTEEI